MHKTISKKDNEIFKLIWLFFIILMVIGGSCYYAGYSDAKIEDTQKISNLKCSEN